VRLQQVMVLWDVDRTLLTTNGASRRALSDAGGNLFGEKSTLDGIDLLGRLDPAIWRDIARANGLSDVNASENRFRATYLDCLRKQQASQSTIRSLPGVRELVRRLAEIKRITQGILSGNYPEIGRLKVQSAGLNFGQFSICVWGSDGETRRDLLPVALARYTELTGLPIDAKQVVIIGDTPRDIDCAKAHGCRCLAVATGRSPKEVLEKAGADLVQVDLTDTEKVVDWICS
jgi:phosphoglycolate phosphatase